MDYLSKTIFEFYKRMFSLGSCSVSINILKLLQVATLLVPTVKTAVTLGKRFYQTSLEIYNSLTFTNNIPTNLQYFDLKKRNHRELEVYADYFYNVQFSFPCVFNSKTVFKRSKNLSDSKGIDLSVCVRERERLTFHLIYAYYDLSSQTLLLLKVIRTPKSGGRFFWYAAVEATCSS